MDLEHLEQAPMPTSDNKGLHVSPSAACVPNAHPDILSIPRDLMYAHHVQPHNHAISLIRRYKCNVVCLRKVYPHSFVRLQVGLLRQ
jgi:hypothetical protein